MFRRDIDRPDIQAFAYTGFGSLSGAAYLFLRVVDAPSARGFLGELRIASIEDLEQAKLAEATQCAITAAGLRALGVRNPPSGDFIRSSSTAWPATRTARCDSATSAPMRQTSGHGASEIASRMRSSCCSARPERIGDLVRETCEAAERSGFSAIETLPTADMGDIEPFGFADGISQPVFDWDLVRTPGTKADRAFTNRIALGEILLGYYNEYGFRADSPKLPPGDPNAALLNQGAGDASVNDLGRNGSYLVFRQLAQDVRGFWRWVGAEAERAGMDPAALAEAMVGRRINGAPLPDIETGLDLPGVDRADRGVNGFVFDADPDGLSCPIGAHIRRANPRTGDAPPGAEGAIDNLLATLGLTARWRRTPTSSTLPWEENNTVWPYLRREDDAIASTRFHRILRRGREYGTKIDRRAALDLTTPDPEAGLQFICLNANIARQFEFVQGAWLASAKFAGLTGEQDPLIGNREPFPAPPMSGTPERTDSFTRPVAEPACRRATGLPQFVTVKGGAYFFMPGLRALKWIASP